MNQDEKYNALRGYIRAVRLADRKIGGRFIVPLKDKLAKEAFGMTFTEANEKGICLRCREKPDLTKMTTEEKHEFLVLSGLCPACWIHLFGEEDGQG